MFLEISLWLYCFDVFQFFLYPSDAFSSSPRINLCVFMFMSKCFLCVSLSCILFMGSWLERVVFVLFPYDYYTCIVGFANIYLKWVIGHLLLRKIIYVLCFKSSQWGLVMPIFFAFEFISILFCSVIANLSGSLFLISIIFLLFKMFKDFSDYRCLRCLRLCAELSSTVSRFNHCNQL